MVGQILITGANGQVGRIIRPHLLERYGALRLSDRDEIEGLAANETAVIAQLDDPSAVAAACEGVDAIVHLGGQPVEADWETINQSNIQGAYTLFEAARMAGVKRIVFASSNHVIGMYPRHSKIGVDHRVRPDSRYGLSKAFGEALGALYADKFGLRVMSIRIGNVTERPSDLRRLSIWIHPEDLVQLVTLGLEHPDLHHEIVYGVSDNVRSFWDNRSAYQLGYRPKHRAEDYATEALEAEADLPPDPIGDQIHGGGFGSAEFDGDMDRLLWS